MALFGPVLHHLWDGEGAIALAPRFVVGQFSFASIILNPYGTRLPGSTYRFLLESPVRSAKSKSVFETSNKYPFRLLPLCTSSLSLSLTMANLYSNFDKVSHDLGEFIRRAKEMHNVERTSDYITFALTGEYEVDGRPKQAVINVTDNRVDHNQLLDISRDYDSAIGVADKILVDAPITVWAVPHPTFALKSSIHLTRSIVHRNVSHKVPYHQIPNFEFGYFGNRHQLYVFFPGLWSPDLAGRERPYQVSERNRSLWYSSGLRPAIELLLGDGVAHDWPASLETEKARAQKTTGGAPSWTQKIIAREFVYPLADTIRQEIQTEPFLDEADTQWAKTFFILHTIRGVKHGYNHTANPVSARYFLNDFIRDCKLVPNAHEDRVGEWWIDVGIEITSEIGACLQWSTGAHRHVVQQFLFISDEDADRITSLNSSKYSRDLSSHLAAVSGFRIEPGAQAEGPFQAAYIQAYTTDKAVVYNVEGSHHAKFLTTSEALSQNHPSKTVDGLYDIYSAAKGPNSSNARLEVRVPWRYATQVLMEFETAVIRQCLYAFSSETWWDFRIIRIVAISQTLHLQATGPSQLRFLPESLLLTAACVWLLNGLHARPEDGPASRDLMDAALPIIEASDAIDLHLAYRATIHPDNHKRIAYIPFGCVFFRRMIVGDVPRLRLSGPILPAKSFKFWFKGLDKDQVQAKYQNAGFVDRNIVALTRFTTNKQRPVPYINMTGAAEPDLFNLAEQGVALAPPTFDDASDVEDRPSTPDAEPQGIDAQISQLWRQFVVDVTSKSPNPRGSANSSYLKLDENERRSGNE